MYKLRCVCVYVLFYIFSSFHIFFLLESYNDAETKKQEIGKRKEGEKDRERKRERKSER